MKNEILMKDSKSTKKSIFCLYLTYVSYNNFPYNRSSILLCSFCLKLRVGISLRSQIINAFQMKSK